MSIKKLKAIKLWVNVLVMIGVIGLSGSSIFAQSSSVFLAQDANSGRHGTSQENKHNAPGNNKNAGNRTQKSYQLEKRKQVDSGYQDEVPLPKEATTEFTPESVPSQKENNNYNAPDEGASTQAGESSQSPDKAKSQPNLSKKQPRTSPKHAPQEANLSEQAMGHFALTHLCAIDKIGSRPAGSEQEKQMQAYISQQLQEMGYEVKVDSFDIQGSKGVHGQSQNISVLKPGKSSREVIVGAHYDTLSVKGNRGTDDNGSGVSLVLEMALRLKDVDTSYSVRFVFFGAGELDMLGSKTYVSNLSSEALNNIVGMINVDSIIVGDKTYVNAGLGGQDWLLDQTVQISSNVGLANILVNPGAHPDYPRSQTGDWSDHAAFNQAGIPIVHMEATNWLLGKRDSYAQTKKHGQIAQTDKDRWDFIDKEFPGRSQENFKKYGTLLYNVLLNVSEPT